MHQVEIVDDKRVDVCDAEALERRLVLLPARSRFRAEVQAAVGFVPL